MQIRAFPSRQRTQVEIRWWKRMYTPLAGSVATQKRPATMYTSGAMAVAWKSSSVMLHLGTCPGKRRNRLSTASRSTENSCSAAPNQKKGSSKMLSSAATLLSQ